MVPSDGTTFSDTILVPDLSIVGTLMFNVAVAGISIKTTRITTADRSS